MATMTGITGSLSGKMGTAVFRQRRGQQIVAQYQPHVNNPRSNRQSDQRARFKLMSQLSAIVADCLGGTMSVLSRPERKGRNPRNNFVHDNFGKSEAVTVDNVITATINLTQVQLTNSARPLGTITLDTTIASDRFKVGISAIPDNVSKVRIVALGSSNNGAPIVIQNSINDVVDNETSAEVYIPPFAAEKKAVVLVYGLIPLSSKASQDLNNIQIIGNDASLVLTQHVLDGSMTETVTIGAEAIWQE